MSLIEACVEHCNMCGCARKKRDNNFSKRESM